MATVLLVLNLVVGIHPLLTLAGGLLLLLTVGQESWLPCEDERVRQSAMGGRQVF